MSKYIKLVENGETVYINVSAVHEARIDESGRLELTIGDPSGQSYSKYLTGNHAQAAKALLDSLTR